MVAQEDEFSPELLALAAEVEASYPDGEEWERIERTVRFRQMCDYLSCLFSPYDGRGFVELRAIRKGVTPARLFLAVADVTGRGDKGVLKEAFRWSHRMNEGEGREVYCGVLPRARRAGRKEDVGEGAWVWGDLDFKVGGRGECFTRLEAAKIQPEVVVNSGGGIHAYWRLSAVMALADAAGVATFETALKRFQQIAQPGSDSVQDISRVLRLPGFYNLKTKEDPRLVVLARVSEVKAPTLN